MNDSTARKVAGYIVIVAVAALIYLISDNTFSAATFVCGAVLHDVWERATRS